MIMSCEAAAFAGSTVAMLVASKVTRVQEEADAQEARRASLPRAHSVEMNRIDSSLGFEVSASFHELPKYDALCDFGKDFFYYSDITLRLGVVAAVIVATLEGVKRIDLR